MTKTSPRKKVLITLFGVLALVGVGGSVLAGQTIESNVTITVGATSSIASGAPGTARASADENQYIQCTIIGVGNANNVFCTAHDAGNNVLACTANQNANFLAVAAAGINPNSKIYFVVDNASGRCTQINSTNGSQYRPAVP